MTFSNVLTLFVLAEVVWEKEMKPVYLDWGRFCLPFAPFPGLCEDSTVVRTQDSLAQSFSSVCLVMAASTWFQQFSEWRCLLQH